MLFVFENCSKLFGNKALYEKIVLKFYIFILFCSRTIFFTLFISYLWITLYIYLDFIRYYILNFSLKNFFIFKILKKKKRIKITKIRDYS